MEFQLYYRISSVVISREFSFSHQSPKHDWGGGGLTIFNTYMRGRSRFYAWQSIREIWKCSRRKADSKPIPVACPWKRLLPVLLHVSSARSALSPIRTVGCGGPWFTGCGAPVALTSSLLKYATSLAPLRDVALPDLLWNAAALVPAQNRHEFSCNRQENHREIVRAYDIQESELRMSKIEKISYIGLLINLCSYLSELVISFFKFCNILFMKNGG